MMLTFVGSETLRAGVDEQAYADQTERAEAFVEGQPSK